MELTNHSYLNSRNNYLSSLSSQKLSAERFASGKKLDRSGTDVGALSQESNRRIELLNDRASITNLKNARSFLYAQETSLHRVYEMYDKIEVLAIKAANPNTTQEERKDYNLEFNDYKEQLENLMLSRYNGKLLFSSTLMCGGPTNIELKELDLANPSNKGGPIGVRAQTVFTGSPTGEVSFRVNSGTTGDTYRVWMGNICVFSAGPSFRGVDHAENYNSNGPRTIPATGVKTEFMDASLYSGHGWRTSGAASNGDDDLITVKFGPGEKTTYTITPGASNDNGTGLTGTNSINGNIWDGTSWKRSVAGDGISDYNQYDTTTKQYFGNQRPNNLGNALENTNGGVDFHSKNNQTGRILTQDLPDTFDRTEMTLQIETSSIGVIYKEEISAANEGTGVDGETYLTDSTGAKIQELDGNGNLLFDSNNDPVYKRKDNIPNTGVIFTPSEFIRKIPTDAHGNVIELNSKGFETLELDFLITAADAQELVDIMRGHGVNPETGLNRFGEMKCLLENRLGILGAEYRRIDYEVEELEKQIVADENALGRITDTDMAKEATNFTKESLKMKLASEVMSNVSRLKDVLIPLTTEHFRSEVLSASL